MKRYLLMVMLAMAAGILVAHGQIQRGNVLVGADISKFDFTLNRGGAFSVNLAPKAAWFIKDNTALGAYLRFNLETAKGTGTKTRYGLGLMVRDYLNRDALGAVRHARLFFEGTLGIEGLDDNQVLPKTSTNGLGFGIGSGLSYFITPTIGLEGLFKYNGITGFGTDGITSDLTFDIGFQIYFPSKTVRKAVRNTQ